MTNDRGMLKFDIIVRAEFKDLNKIYDFGNEFLKSENIIAVNLISADECNFCHMDIASENVIEDINKKGYSVFKHWGFTNNSDSL